MLHQLEASTLSTWIRESDAIYAFPGILIVHTVGMALAAGGVGAIGLRLLGVARQIPIGSLRELVRVAWIGLLLNIVSGTLLVVAYPTKALTNPVFYLKLVVIVAAVSVVRHLDRRLLAGEASPRKLVPAAMLILAALAIITGRLLPYTYRHLMAGY
jgi:hypothetical protein